MPIDPEDVRRQVDEHLKEPHTRPNDPERAKRIMAKIDAIRDMPLGELIVRCALAELRVEDLEKRLRGLN